MHRNHERRSAYVVVGGIADHVFHAHAQPDQRGLMTHRIDSAQQLTPKPQKLESIKM